MHALTPACVCYQCAWRIHHCLWWYSLPEKGDLRPSKFVCLHWLVMDSLSGEQGRAFGDVVNAFFAPEYQVGDKRPPHFAPIPETQLPVDHSLVHDNSESIPVPTHGSASAQSGQGAFVQETQEQLQPEGQDGEYDSEGDPSFVSSAEVPPEWMPSMLTLFSASLFHHSFT